MSEWISVENCLPIDEQEVLLFIQAEMWTADYDTKKAINGFYIHKEKAIGCIKDNKLWINYDQVGCFSVKDITHWMPLPEPPK